MEGDRAEFLNFLREHVAKFADTRSGLAQNEEHDLFAMVRHSLHFLDGTCVWLAKFEIRPLLDAEENRQFEICRNGLVNTTLPEADFDEIELTDGRRLEPSKGTREILQVLRAAGGKKISNHALKTDVARIRGVKELPEKYSAVKALKATEAGRYLLDQKIICYEREAGRGTRYWLNWSGAKKINLSANSEQSA
jgi:hypothetical protein